MGDRGNIVIKQKDDDLIFLYTHWGGHDIKETLSKALARGRDRWDDESYLARIIFEEMISVDRNGSTGFGISTYPPDNDGYPFLVVDMKSQKVFEHEALDEKPFIGKKLNCWMFSSLAEELDGKQSR